MADGTLFPSSDVGSHADRDASGRFAQGNRAAVVTGERSVAFWRAQQSLRHDIVVAVLGDQGQADDPPYALRAAAHGLAQAIIIRDSAYQRLLDVGGPLTEKDRERSAFKVWLAAADRVERYVRLVGLGRQARDLSTMSLADYVNAQQSQGGTTDAD